MKFSVDRETLLKPLQIVQGVVERRQTLPILSNVLLVLRDGELSITATDMEVELVAHASLGQSEDGEITVPARKFIDICRTLPAEALIEFKTEADRAIIKSGRSRFNLSTLPATDYPNTEMLSEALSFEMDQAGLKTLIDLTQFAMAHQDVRYYLNGLLLEISPDGMRSIATDGHRLAMAELKVDCKLDEPRQIIVPRKAVAELARLLSSEEGTVQLEIGANAVRLSLPDLQLTSKLIDGRFPDYERVIPEIDECDKVIVIERDLLRQCLTRASILSNEKYRAIRLSLDSGVLRIVANNPDQEEAEDELEVDYSGDPLEVGFNVSYLIDALATLPSDTARLLLTDASSSCLILCEGRDDCQYVVMPMRL